MVTSNCKQYVLFNRSHLLKEVQPRYFRLLALFLGLLLLGLQLPAWADNVISGTVSLPAGDVAQAGGQVVTVTATDTNSAKFVFTSIQIQQGDSSKTYSLSVPSDASASWQISYDCGLLCESYVRTGYYSNTGTTWDKAAATILPGGADHSGIDITLLSGDSISGQVFLPQGEVAPNGGLWVSLLLIDNAVGSYFGSVKIEEGESSVTYKRVVPSLVTANWKIKYMCSGTDCAPYYEFGWYSAGGTTWNSLDATALSGGSDHGNIDLTLLYGDRFSGRITLPDGDVAPSGGMRFDASIVNIHTNDQFQRFFVIPQGDASVPYDMVVPASSMTDWSVAYVCNDTACQSYVPKAYYLDGGMTLDKAQATVFPSGADYSHIDLRVAMNLSSSCMQADETIIGPLTYAGDYYCSAGNSITAGQNGVQVGDGTQAGSAYVVYSAPEISLMPGFAVADHGIFRAGKNLLP